ncbi:hemoglobin subunit alpha-like [Pristis pectinata]|uniref:hemoglobin subunit alpha-like n=1 Tax=Pristis pectinata TaxID=685728 RepID=UPI00223D648D|nr:hemoglobin subunit alpha-like [Pristis pectinata]
MVLSDANRQVIESLGRDLAANAEALGADALARLFDVHPQTKTYFPKFTGFKSSDQQVKDHGHQVMKAVAKAAQNLDNLPTHMRELAKKHGKELLVDPQNFNLFADCIAVTLAIYLSSFPAAAHCAVDKFLELLTHELRSDYR